MPIEILMPSTGGDMTEGNIARWSVKPGDAVRKDAVLLEIETDKALVEVPAPGDGVVPDEEVDGRRGPGDLDEPDVEISVEVRERVAYLFSASLAGPGGMPLGTQGRVLCDLPSERGIASAWLMMKRGCSVLLMCDDDKVVAPLRNWYPNLKSMDRREDLFAAAADNGRGAPMVNSVSLERQAAVEVAVATAAGDLSADGERPRHR